ncbi:MAG: hypothetical protein V7K21_13425 [Nostoc sp.]|uniref:hypothetical protein n=1 Tax=Nostoc sp. TaxID=1180 RepID=UPI002FF4C80D
MSSFLYLPFNVQTGEQDGDSVEAMIQRCVAAQKLLVGELPPGEFLDLLDYQGFDVVQVVDACNKECPGI